MSSSRISPHAGERPRRAGARRVARTLSSGPLALFTETIVASLAVGLLTLPVVTVLPAFAAGAAHLRRHIDGEADSFAGLLRDFWSALRSGWIWSLVLAVAFTAIVITVTSPMTSAMPGGEAFRWVSLVVGAIAAVLLLRTAARWRPGAHCGATIRAVADSMVRDVRSTLMLLLALGLSFLIVWMFAPLVVLVPGMLTFAAHAVETPRRGRAGKDEDD